ncbi:MAG: sulfurtransferase [Hyphomicrobiales bacterium]|nr:sulfurtransferase [Hyphomicrobiales bacterium]
MASSPLVTTAWLEEHLGDPDLRVIEVCSLNDPKIYHEGHIPGAMWVYWKAACWQETDRDFVTPAAMARAFGAMGIGPRSTVVLYGDPVQYGSYAFWAFTMAGHASLRLLDGGRRKWLLEGRPLSRNVPRFAAVDYPTPAGNTTMRVGRRDVRDHLRQPQRLLIDLRSPEEYSGKRVSEYSFAVDHGAERTGRIPGAVHLFFKELLNDDDSFKSPEALRAVLAGAGIDPAKFNDVVCYCRLSHRATMGWMALTHILGFPNVRIYDGSWTEWGSIVGYPIER